MYNSDAENQMRQAREAMERQQTAEREREAANARRRAEEQTRINELYKSQERERERQKEEARMAAAAQKAQDDLQKMQAENAAKSTEWYNDRKRKQAESDANARRLKAEKDLERKAETPQSETPSEEKQEAVVVFWLTLCLLVFIAPGVIILRTLATVIDTTIPYAVWLSLLASILLLVGIRYKAKSWGPTFKLYGFLALVSIISIFCIKDFFARLDW